MSNIAIDAFNEKYHQNIISLILDIQQKEFGIEITIEDQPDLANIKDFYLKEQGNFWFARCGDEVVGTIALLDIDEKFLALRKMFVKEAFRGQPYNAALKLLKTAIQWAEQYNKQAIYLGTTSKFLAAQRFYEKNNFVKVEKENLPQAFPVMKVDSVFYRYNICNENK